MAKELPPIPPISEWLKEGSAYRESQRRDPARGKRTEFAKNMLETETTTFTASEREAAMAILSPAKMRRYKVR